MQRRIANDRSKLLVSRREILLEHRLNGNDRVAVGECVLLGRVAQFLVNDDDVFRESDTGPEKIVEAVDRAEHPIDQREIGDRIEKGNFRSPLQQQYYRVQRRFRSAQ